MKNQLQKIRELVRKNDFIRKWIAFRLVPTGLFDRIILSKPLSELWKERLKITLSSPDNMLIPRVPDAGKVVRGRQVMHNGLKINLGSYYGPEVAQVLKANKGVHEPQEERVFAEVLNVLPEEALMIELGAFWGFYSMWFQKEVPGAKNYLIEPDSFNRRSGELNFQLNDMNGEFYSYFVGKDWNEYTRQMNMNTFITRQGVERVHILHSDIQGFELEMLEGAADVLDRVWYLFISTHSNELHRDCETFLASRRFKILTSVNKEESFSEDGLIVAQNPNLDLLEPVDVSRRTKPLEKE